MRVKIGTVQIIIRREENPKLLERLGKLYRRLEGIRRALIPLAVDVAPIRSRAQEEQRMKNFEDANAALNALDTVTTTIADQVGKVATRETAQIDELTRLRDQVANGSPVTAEQFDGLVARAEGLKASLETIEGNLRPLAADEANPVPDPTPDPTPGDEV